MAGGLSEDIQGLFLLIARAALDQAPCPSDAEVARVCGSRSTGRATRLLAYMESQGLLVCRHDLRGNRIIALPELGWTRSEDRRVGKEGGRKCSYRWSPDQ